MTVEVQILRLPSAYDLPLPAYARHGDSGLDLRAAEEVWIDPGTTVAVPTGFAVAIPEGYEGQIRPRSGLAAKHGITVLNTPGTIDSGYRGEVVVLLHNAKPGQPPISHHVKRGDRIAQLVIAPVARAELVEVRELPETDRGQGGFGSTGIG